MNHILQQLATSVTTAAHRMALNISKFVSRVSTPALRVVKRSPEYAFRGLMLFGAAWMLEAADSAIHSGLQLATLPYGSNTGLYGPIAHAAAWIALHGFGILVLVVILGASNFYTVAVSEIFAGRDLLGNSRVGKAFRSTSKPIFAAMLISMALGSIDLIHH